MIDGSVKQVNASLFCFLVFILNNVFALVDIMGATPKIALT